jgi:hypothetical protein
MLGLEYLGSTCLSPSTINFKSKLERSVAYRIGAK